MNRAADPAALGPDERVVPEDDNSPVGGLSVTEKDASQSLNTARTVRRTSIRRAVTLDTFMFAEIEQTPGAFER
jgi:hypothetical protein